MKPARKSAKLPVEGAATAFRGVGGGEVFPATAGAAQALCAKKSPAANSRQVRNRLMNPPLGAAGRDRLIDGRIAAAP